MNQMQLLYVKDLLYISWETTLPADIYWWKEQQEIRLGRLSIVYG